MKIQFVDLQRQRARIDAELRSRIEGVLGHARFIMGPEIAELEARLADFAGVAHAITCSSGTDALVMALMAHGVARGDAVLTTPFSFIATAEAIALAGARPVFVDIESRSFNIDVGQLERAIAEADEAERGRLRGIVPVDLFGLPADYEAIMKLADEHGLFVLEDAAQSFGASYKGSRAGALGHSAGLSFFPAKPLGCYGDGGAVLTDDDALAEQLVSIRVHGTGEHKFDNVRLGMNGRLDTLQAAVLLAKFSIFGDELEARQRVAERYSLRLENSVETPTAPAGSRSAWAQYSILSDRRDAIQAALKRAGIPSAIYYPKPLHLQTAFAGLGVGEGAFPVAEATSRRILALPIHPYLGDDEIDFVCEQVVAAARG